ncbi:CYTH and CHAD domain-containing protein [Janthinobacterium sp. 17J80-10]|uniref:CYTH and CHAD domain-containing protein n=1 Tax=Janthinobacterium sp. 17J80-10 TaxID=2497863 RepID=UPI0010053192|nr:CYTH and CHAD domain-containing protein [Janthinobacterium sp. 17J80-10]QAU32783.1 CYTH and CHAD domain-containing protein [Janthinobacterium sp. 17J80-10]
MEIELKLLVEPRHLPALRRLPLLQQYACAPPRTLHMRDIYFDTPDLAIRNNNAGLRVRQVEGAWIQTLKGGGSVASGLHSRHEWESRVAGPHPDLAALAMIVDRQCTWSRLLRQPDLAARLEAAFTTDIRRTLWELRLAQGDMVEFVLDEGSIECRGDKTAVCEIEIELKSGAPEHLFDFALLLLEAIPLRLSNSSKAARGYGLYRPQAPAIVRAAPLRLARELTVEEGFRVIVGNCLAQIQGNEAAVVDGSAAEGIHQMRVGLRRLRSALKLFRKHAPCPPQLLAELAWLGDALGQARDWEVLLDATLPRLAPLLPQSAALALLQQAIETIVADHHQEAASAVASERFARLALNLGAWLVGARWRGPVAGRRQRKLDAPLVKFARKALAGNQAALLRKGKRLPHAGPAERHRVRIAAKKARYATEFFQSLQAPRRVRPYIAALAALQETLGWLNDAAVAQSLLASLQQAGTATAELAGAAGMVRGYLSAAPALTQAELLELWKKFARTRPPCRS